METTWTSQKWYQLICINDQVETEDQMYVVNAEEEGGGDGEPSTFTTAERAKEILLSRCEDLDLNPEDFRVMEVMESYRIL